MGKEEHEFTVAGVLLALATLVAGALFGHYQTDTYHEKFAELQAQFNEYAEKMSDHDRDEFDRGYESGKMMQVAEIVHAKAAEYQLDKATGKPRLVYKIARSACQCVSCNCK